MFNQAEASLPCLMCRVHAAAVPTLNTASSLTHTDPSDITPHSSCVESVRTRPSTCRSPGGNDTSPAQSVTFGTLSAVFAPHAGGDSITNVGRLRAAQQDASAPADAQPRPGARPGAQHQVRRPRYGP